MIIHNYLAVEKRDTLIEKKWVQIKEHLHGYQL